MTCMAITEVLQRNVIYEEGYMTSLWRLTQEKRHSANRLMVETMQFKKTNISTLAMWQWGGVGN